MHLFSYFTDPFQLSWRVWKKIMYAFWIVVIGFSMLTLIMIYTYQFDRFDKYWDEYIGINIQLLVYFTVYFKSEFQHSESNHTK